MTKSVDFVPGLNQNLSATTNESVTVLKELAQSDDVKSVDVARGKVVLDNGITQNVSSDASTVTISDRASDTSLQVHVNSATGDVSVKISDPTMGSAQVAAAEALLEDFIKDEVLTQAQANGEHWLLALTDRLSEVLNSQQAALDEALQSIISGVFTAEDVARVEQRLRSLNSAQRDSTNILRRYAEGLGDLGEASRSEEQEDDRKRAKRRVETQPGTSLELQRKPLVEAAPEAELDETIRKALQADLERGR